MQTNRKRLTETADKIADSRPRERARERKRESQREKERERETATETEAYTDIRAKKWTKKEENLHAPRFDNSKGNHTGIGQDDCAIKTI